MNRTLQMRQASAKKPASDEAAGRFWVTGSREAALIALYSVALYLLISLSTYHSGDPGWSHSGHVDQVHNQGGVVGAWIADVFLYLFGYLAYLLPVMFGYLGWVVYRGDSPHAGGDVYQCVIRFCGLLLAIGGGSGLATLHFSGVGVLPLDSGGGDRQSGR